MIDQSHKWIFFTATALMCAVSFAGAQLAQAEAPDPMASFGAPRQLSLPPGFSAYGESKDAPVNTASIVPNGRSCPSVNTAAILTPSGTELSAPATRGIGAALGTGSGCLPTRPDVAAGPLAPPEPTVLPAHGSTPHPTGD